MPNKHHYKGGLAVLQKYGQAHMAAIGKVGGLATVQKYGIEHMRAIGRAGAAATWKRYTLKPLGTSHWALVDRKTGKVKTTW